MILSMEIIGTVEGGILIIAIFLNILKIIEIQVSNFLPELLILIVILSVSFFYFYKKTWLFIENAGIIKLRYGRSGVS